MISKKFGILRTFPFAGGCGLGAKRAIHEAAGGYDVTLPYLRDTDYCFKIQMTGVELHFVPGALIHIGCRKTFRNIFNQGRKWAEYIVIVYKRYQKLTSLKIVGAWRCYDSNWKNYLCFF
jgi:GT2 family glycosyltransferase